MYSRWQYVRCAKTSHELGWKVKVMIKETEKRNVPTKENSRLVKLVYHDHETAAHYLLVPNTGTL